MPIFCGTPLGRQSPYSVYKFPSAAQVGIHESQPWVDVICFISDLASHVMGPTIAEAVTSSGLPTSVSSTVLLHAAIETAKRQLQKESERVPNEQGMAESTGSRG